MIDTVGTLPFSTLARTELFINGFRLSLSDKNLEKWKQISMTKTKTTSPMTWRIYVTWTLLGGFFFAPDKHCTMWAWFIVFWMIQNAKVQNHLRFVYFDWNVRIEEALIKLIALGFPVDVIDIDFDKVPIPRILWLGLNWFD